MSESGAFLKCVSTLPFAHDGELHDGLVKKQIKYCKDKCASRDCLTFLQKPPGHYSCSKGFSCLPVTIGDTHLVINGIIDADNNHGFTGERRNQYRANISTRKDIDEAILNIEAGLKQFAGAANEGARDAVSFFHDIRTSVGVVLSWSQKLIALSPGASFEEKLDAAEPSTHNLFRAINLLQEQLELADIYANPAAITYGHKRSSSLTGFWYRMVKLFEPRAAGRGIDIRFLAHGNEVDVKAYNSIQFLPLILLDNAIKYSFKGKTIYVELSIVAGGISIAVSSFGKTVAPEYRAKIFEKHVRGPNGMEENPEGMGMGLYIAEKIVTAHGFQLYYEHPSPDVPVGNNKFVVVIPDGHYSVKM
jgi:signal transduction histidine kinase